MKSVDSAVLAALHSGLAREYWSSTNFPWTVQCFTWLSNHSRVQSAVGHPWTVQ